MNYEDLYYEPFGCRYFPLFLASHLAGLNWAEMTWKNSVQRNLKCWRRWRNGMQAGRFSIKVPSDSTGLAVMPPVWNRFLGGNMVSIVEFAQPTVGNEPTSRATEHAVYSIRLLYFVKETCEPWQRRFHLMSIPIFVRCTFSSSWKPRHFEPSLKCKVIRRCCLYMMQMDQLLRSWILCSFLEIIRLYDVSVFFCEDPWRLCHATLLQSALSLPLRGDGASHWSAHGIPAQQRHIAMTQGASGHEEALYAGRHPVEQWCDQFQAFIAHYHSVVSWPSCYLL